jgi:hypothetical protein
MLCVVMCGLSEGCAEPVRRGEAGAVQTGQGAGLASTRAAEQVAELTPVERVWDSELEAWVCPPAGWRLDPPKRTEKHVHKTWVSPTGLTAYGVIHFSLPVPLTHELALWGFMREMRRVQGDGVLLAKESDERMPMGRELDGGGGMRFVAEGGKYKVRTNMVVRGGTGWCVYAGTLRGKREDVVELAEAERRREETRVGRR